MINQEGWVIIPKSHQNRTRDLFNSFFSCRIVYMQGLVLSTLHVDLELRIVLNCSVKIG